MRRNALLCLICLIVLAACGGGGEQPTTAPQVDSGGATPAASSTTDPNAQPAITITPALQREFATGEPPLPIPGTLVNVVTEDPEAALLFDVVLFSRTGGAEGVPLTVEILQNGTVTRDGVATNITADQVKLIDDQIDLINFFGIEGVFEAPGRSAQVYHYELTVDRNGSSKTIKADDGLIPPQLSQLFSLLMAVGAPSQ